MHATARRPILRMLHLFLAHWIFADILPLLRVIFAIAQPVMKTAGLKFSCIWKRFRQPVFPKANPPLDGEFQIAWRAEQMQMIRHQEIVAHQPRCRRVFPDVVQGALHRSLRQPTLALLGADGEKNPVRSAERNVNPFGRRVAARFAERRFTHADFLTHRRRMGKFFGMGALGIKMGRAAALPYQIKSR